MKNISLTSLIAILSVCNYAGAHEMNGKAGSGLIGYGINMYKPYCASACHDTVPMKMHCEDGSDTMTMPDGDPPMPSAECVSTNTPFLQSVAYCVNQKCPSSLNQKVIDHWWTYDMLGRAVNQPKPNLTFEQALQSVKLSIPTNTLSSDDVLESPVLVNDTEYISNYHASLSFQGAEQTHSATRLNFQSWQAPQYHFNLPFIGKSTAQMPTYGQMLAVAMVWIINIILSSVGYRSYQPNAWFASTRLEILTYITNRTGALSFVNIVLLIIYAGRNNPLLLATNWSRSTYILLHKNVAIIATIQACLHSAIYLQIKIADGTLSTEQVSPYWIMGIVATLSMTVLLPLSIKSIRNAMYEIFLIVHIVFAILALVGCWYHIIWRFQHQWGYEIWLYISFAVWGAERAIRIVRLLMYSGLEKAIILPLDENYLKIIVPTAQQSPFKGGVIYAYFPTLSWRPWESHPFSVAGPALEWKKTSNTKSEKIRESVANSPNLLEKGIIQLDKTEDTRDPESPALKNDDSNALANVQTQEYKQDWQISSAVSINGGITFFVRVRNGTTKRLAEKANHDTKICTLPVLLEGAYDCGEVGSYSTNIHSSKSQFSKIICIAGGVGITALMPILHKASRSQNIESNTAVSLHWSSRSSALVNSISSMLNINTTGTSEQRGNVGMLSTHCVIGQRLEGSEVLEEEMRGSETKGNSILILVCAPTDMARAYQNHAIAYKSLGYAVTYHEEQFSW